MKRQWTQSELDSYGKEYCAILRKSIKNHRKKRMPDITKTDKWDIPRVAVACSSTVSPYYRVRGRNASTLKNPHPTLYATYPSVKKDVNPPAFPGEPHYQEGHCAEPHAAHKLLNRMDRRRIRMNINEIMFGKAYHVCNSVEIAYCATCKLTFPQLR